MAPAPDPSRRAALGALALLGSGAATSAAGQAVSGRGAVKTLVAYFSRSGNTRVIAGQLHRALGADILEIQPAQPYPEDYQQTVDQARRERDSGFRPALKAKAPIEAYQTIYLGLPIWGETAPPIIRSFLSTHDFKGKDLRPFITHGGYGLGGSRAVLASHAPGARLHDPFSMECDQERRTLDQVTDWLKTNSP